MSGFFCYRFFQKTGLVFVSGFLLLANALAVEVDPRAFANAEQERRYHLLTEQFRCVVCQNQSVAESNSKVALAVRELVYTMLQAGESDEAIKAHLVDSYGDFVLYDPPLKSTTYFLWLGPLFLLFIALVTLFYFVRRQMSQATAELTPEEREKLSHFVEPK